MRALVRATVCAGVVLASCVAVPPAVADDGTCDSWVSATSGDWNDPTMWSAGVPDESTDACITVPGSYMVSLTRASVDSLTLGAGRGPRPTLAIAAATGYSSLYVTGDLINRATIRARTTEIYVRGRFLNAGTLHASQCVELDAPDMTNTGAVRVTSGLVEYMPHYDRGEAPGLFQNFGIVTVGQNAGLRVGAIQYWKPTTFANEPGAVVAMAASSLFAIVDGGFDLNGGSVTGAPVRFVGFYDGVSQVGNADLVDHGDGAASFEFDHSGTFTGDVAAGQHIDVLPNYYETSLALNGPVTNAGTIRIVGTPGATGSGVYAPQTLTNTGRIELDAEGSGDVQPSSLYGRIVNDGTIEVTTPNGRFQRGVLINHGAISCSFGVFTVSQARLRNQAGSVAGYGVRVDNAIFEEGAGTTASAPVALSHGSELDLVGKGASSFVFTSSGTIAGDVARNQKVTLPPTTDGVATVLEAKSGFSNAGAIEFPFGQAGTSAAVLQWPGTLTNTGTMNVASPAQFSGTLLNAGTFQISRADLAIPLLVRFHQTAAGTLSTVADRETAGHFAPTDGAILGGTLDVTGDLTHGSVVPLIDATTFVRGRFTTITNPNLRVFYEGTDGVQLFGDGD